MSFLLRYVDDGENIFIDVVGGWWEVDELWEEERCLVKCTER